MLTENHQLMRALCPKITPQAAMRMFAQHATSIALTSCTLGVQWWIAYVDTWTNVMFPKGAGK